MCDLKNNLAVLDSEPVIRKSRNPNSNNISPIKVNKVLIDKKRIGDQEFPIELFINAIDDVEEN